MKCGQSEIDRPTSGSVISIVQKNSCVSYQVLCLFVAEGAERSSEVERSLMVRWVVGSILHGVDPLSNFRSSQCSTTGVTKAVVCVILSVGWCI